MRGAARWLAVPILSLATQATAEEPLRLTYRTYAVGMPIADVEGMIGIGRWTYQLTLSFRTIGAARLVFAGHAASSVFGTWQDGRPAPRKYDADGVWRGERRATLIDYDQGIPAIRLLLPPPEADREIVAEGLRSNSSDTLSAVAALVRIVADSGHCESTQRIFDGRRAADMTARTVGPEILPPDTRSSFSGPTLRCDFVSRILAGFRHDEANRTDYRPLRGSAWLAVVAPGHLAIPVRVTLETRWFGEATVYLTGADASGRQ